MGELTYYTENLSGFFHILRGEGFLVGTDEILDITKLFNIVDLTKHFQMRESMKAVLAKSQRERRVFDEVFDEFFVGKEVLTEREVVKDIQEARRRRRIDYAKEDLPGYEVSDELAEAYAGATGERKIWLKNMLDYAQGGNRNLPLMKEYIKKIATGWLIAEAGYGMEAPDDENSILDKNLTSITEEEVPHALRLIEALVRRINLASERKRQRIGRRGMPDLRRTIHESLRTGGVPVKPVYKRRPRTSRRFIILCDISESMVLFSEFALRFIVSLGRESGKTRAFIFSEGAEEIGLQDLTHFEQSVRNSTLWRRGTDIGSALNYLVETRPIVLDSSVTLIVLSDAKTVAQQTAEAALNEVERRTKSIIWLNPDRQFSSFAEKLAERVVMLRSGTLDELARACSRLNF